VKTETVLGSERGGRQISTRWLARGKLKQSRPGETVSARRDEWGERGSESEDDRSMSICIIPEPQSWLQRRYTEPIE
jgi:hypothetical protein